MRRFLAWLRRKVDPTPFVAAKPEISPPAEEYREPSRFKQLSAWAKECRAEVHAKLAARPRPASRPKGAPD